MGSEQTQTSSKSKDQLQTNSSTVVPVVTSPIESTSTSTAV